LLGPRCLIGYRHLPDEALVQKPFALMSRNATNPPTFFGIPPNRVVELGAQVKL
jgi:KUP system potassium uptake protein